MKEKLVIATILTVALVCTSCFIIASSEQVVADDQTDVQNDTISNQNSEEMRIGAHAFEGCEKINLLDVRKATVIGSYAFKDCSEIKLVEESNVNRVNDGVFMNCWNLRFVNFVQPINYIGADAFAYCFSLYYMYFDVPDNDLLKINDRAFIACQYLDTIPFDKVEYIGNDAFHDARKITEVNLPNCTYIGNSAFYRCYNLTTVVLGDKINVIEKSAFGEDNKLKSVEFQGKVAVKDSAFSGCNLEHINMENVTYIGNYAFKFSSLKSISFGNELKFIGNNAFQYCSSLESIEFNSIVDIGDYAFERTSLSKVPLQNIRNIGSYAFSECHNIKTLDFPKTSDVKMSIQDHAFKNCFIEYLEIGDSVVYIGNEAFFNENGRFDKIKKPDITRIVLGNGLKNVDAHAFGYDVMSEYGREITDAKYLNDKILVKNGASYTAYTKAVVDIGENIILSYGNEMHSNEKVYLGVGEEIVFGFDHKAGYKYVLTINGEVVEDSGMFQRWIVTGDAEFRVEYIPLFKPQSSQSDMNELDSYSLPNVAIDNSPSMENWTLPSNLNPMLPSNEFKHAYSFPQAKSY